MNNEIVDIGEFLFETYSLSGSSSVSSATSDSCKGPPHFYAHSMHSFDIHSMMQQTNSELMRPPQFNLPSFQFGRDDKSSLETLINIAEGGNLPEENVFEALRSLGPEKLRKIYSSISE